MPQILFIHDKCVWYRRTLFDMLSKSHRVLFVFTDGKRVNGFEAEHVVLHRYGWRSFSFAFGLLPVLLGEQCDLIVFPPPDSPGELFDDLLCFVAAKIRRKPYLVWVGKWGWGNDGTPPIRRLYQALGQVFIGFFYRSADACVSYGTKQKAYLLSLNVDEEKIFIAPQASMARQSAEDSSPEEIKKDLGLDGKKVVLYIGRLIKRKGADYLIEAFAELRKERDDVHLLIIGGEGWYGNEEHLNLDQLKKLSEDTGLRLGQDVSFLGEIENENLSKYYAMADVFVLPSITHRLGEPWGLVLNEAMQFGKPVIATDAVGAAYDLIENGVNGFVVPEKNVEALHQALSRILSDPKTAERMGRESKRIIGEYTYVRMLDGFERAIAYALRSNKK